MSKNIFDGIIFDLDGTLWDSTEAVAHSWNTACGCNRFTADDVKSIMGLTMEEIAAKFFPEKSPSERAEIIEKCCKVENEYLRFHGGSIYPNTEKTLRELAKSYKLFIVSNCQKGYIEAFLEYYKLGDVISGALCWGDTRSQVSPPKNGTDAVQQSGDFGDTNSPKADNISAIINRHGLKNPLYVGDTQGDCNSAYKAKAKFAFAAYGFGTADRMEFRLNDIGDLTHILKNMNTHSSTSRTDMAGCVALDALSAVADIVSEIDIGDIFDIFD